MRHCVILILVFASVIVSAQNKTATPFITPIVQPFGEIASIKIDSKGGKLRSVDGGLEIVIPENAVEAETLITIQSSHNDLNENDEGAYQLEPSGINFKKPVQLNFRYKDDNDGLKSIAWQDAEGKWYSIKNILVDTIQKIVSCSVSHFSRWAKFDRMYISPSAATVKVNKTKTLTIKIYTPPEKGHEDDELLATPPVKGHEDDNILATPPVKGHEDDELLASPENSFNVKEWAVNGIVNGDISTVGSVSKQGSRNATYMAPAVVPSGNPVAVSVQIYSNKKNKKLLLTSNITIVGDQYRFTYIHVDDRGCFFVHDSSSCIFNMEKNNVRISNIINYNNWSDWPNCGGCKYTYNKAAFKGLVEITGIANSTITPPAKESGSTNVNIMFSPAMGNTEEATVKCKDNSYSIPSRPMPADPKFINFDIDGENIIIHYHGKTGTNELIDQGKKEKTIIHIYKVN